MRRERVFLVIFIFCSMLFTVCTVSAQSSQFQSNQSQSEIVLKKQLRSPEILKFLNSEVSVEGYYYAGSIPMIIDNIERTYDNIPLPTHSFIPIVGNIPAGIKSGDRISVKGILRKPEQKDPKTVRAESVVIQTLNIQKLADARLTDKRTSSFFDQIKDKFTDIPKIDDSVTEPPSEQIKERIRKSRIIETIEKIGPHQAYPEGKYAVLIAGGGGYESNHIRYWNDLLCMYQILRDRGYPAENINVLYHDGFEPDDKVEAKVKGTIPNILEASRENIERVFNNLATKMTSHDKLFIMINNHGGGLLLKKRGDLEAGLQSARFDTDNEQTEDLISEAQYNQDYNKDKDKNDLLRVDEAIILGPNRGTMYDDEFAEQVNKIRHYKVMIIVMEQCFSGGFIDDLRGPNRIIMSAAGPNQISRARWPKAGGVAKYNEFTYWFFTVLMGRTPDGEKIRDRKGKEVAIDIDWDENGKISMQEAFNWARRMHYTDDTPHYDDNNQPPASTGWIHYHYYSQDPTQEGFLGSRTFLE